MTELPKPSKHRAPKPMTGRQTRIVFESSELQGLTHAQRMKAVMQLARVLMLAAGAALEESDDER